MIHVTESSSCTRWRARAGRCRARRRSPLRVPRCREQARAIDEVVQELPDTLPARGSRRSSRPHPRLSQRGADRGPRPAARDAWTARLCDRAGARGGAVAPVGAAALVNENLSLSNQLRVVGNERATYESIVEGIARAAAGGTWPARTTGPVPAERSSPRAPRVVRRLSCSTI